MSHSQGVNTDQNTHTHKCRRTANETNLPRRGTASEVAGIVSATMLRKTVRDSKIVTPENKPQTRIKNRFREKFCLKMFLNFTEELEL